TATISYNTANIKGGGVYVGDDWNAYLYVDGIVVIQDNTSGNTKSNLYLDGSLTTTGGRIQFVENGVFNTTSSQIGITQTTTGEGFTSDAGDVFTGSDWLNQYSVFTPDLGTYELDTIEDSSGTEFTLRFTGSIASLFGGGDGSAANPYLISNLTHLNNLSAHLSEVNGRHFKQTNNITITGGYNPIGSAYNTAFTGTYNGNGYTISGSINNEGASNIGVFGYIGSSGTVKNLTTNLAVTGNDNVGGIAGANDGTIESCYNIGSITAIDGTVGGIAGTNNRTIQYCYNKGTITGATTGGIAGKNGYSTAEECSGSILHCYNTGTINGTDDAGGIAGSVDEGTTIQYCYNIGEYEIDVKTGSGSIVGMINSVEATIQYCYHLSGTEIGAINRPDLSYYESVTNNTTLTLEQMTGEVARLNMAYLFAQKKEDGSTIWYTNESGTPHFTPPYVPEEEVATTTTTTTTLLDRWYTVMVSSTEGGMLGRNGSGYVVDNDEEVEQEFYSLTTIKMQEGTTSNFFIFPASGYVIGGVYVDGILIGTMDTYILEDIQEDQRIHVEFVPVSTKVTDSEEEEEEEEEVIEVVEAPDIDDIETVEEVEETPEPAESNLDEVPEEEKGKGTRLALLVGGIVAAVLALGGLGYWFLKRKKSRETKK
ncbi:MAG: hypothetical protein R3Y67_04095, partial [Eubacteriales bacterium]